MSGAAPDAPPLLTTSGLTMRFGGVVAVNDVSLTLPALSLHGLRKALGRRIVEAGGTAHEVMAVLGHESLVEAERYTRTYARKASATAAVRKVEARGFTTQTRQHIDDVMKPPPAG